MLNKALIRSGISAQHNMQEAYMGAEAWYIDPHPTAQNDLVFKANRACVKAIVSNRDSPDRPFGCDEGKLIAGMYATPVYHFKQKLTRDLQVKFGHNTVKPRYVTHPEVLADIVRKHKRASNKNNGSDGAK